MSGLTSVGTAAPGSGGAGPARGCLPRRRAPLVAAAVLLLAACYCHTAAAIVPGGYWHVYYDWPALARPRDAYSASVDMTVLTPPKPPANLFWAFNCFFSDKVAANSSVVLDSGEPGAYTGIQMHEKVKKFIFSVWGASRGVPDAALARQTNPLSKLRRGRCGPFGGEGVGWQCFAEIDWKAGVPYRFNVSLLKRDASADVFRATVSDTTTGAKWLIGDITVPGYYGRITYSAYFSENFWEVPSCAKAPYHKIKFSNLGMRSAGKALPPKFAYADMGDAERCPGWVSLDICGTTVTSAGPLAKPINPNGPAIKNKC